MSEYKVNIGDPKTGKTSKKDFTAEESKEFSGKKIGDKIKGEKIGFPGYEFEITGGSDSSGFPMRKDVSGSARKRILITGGVGTRHNRKGIRLRRTVVGNTIGAKTAQINLKVLKHGKDALDTAPATSAEDAPAADASKEETKAEEAKTEDKPVEEAKAEKKPAEEAKAVAPKEEGKAEEKPKEKAEKTPKEEAAEEKKDKKPSEKK